uniref:Uncharacterized protein n=1 Tax=Lepeophtheirus salmonis TaxID=72036 RepID=A0A0K2VLM6_LEPSM
MLTIQKKAYQKHSHQLTRTTLAKKLCIQNTEALLSNLQQMTDRCA